MQTSPLAPTSLGTLHPVEGTTLITYACGLKYKDRDDMLIALLDEGSVMAGVFTKSTTASANIQWGRSHLADLQKSVRAIVVNAGNANAFNGKFGYETVEILCNHLGSAIGCQPHEVIACATGVIGEPLPNNLITNAITDALTKPSYATIEEAAGAIRTTDTFSKAVSTQITLQDSTITITGIIKGSGMIAPNMATMLGYIFTDAVIDGNTLQQALSTVTETTFNAITVDSDTSTSDTILALATQKAGNAPITQNSSAYEQFQETLGHIAHELAMLVIKDGEGVTKIIEVQVRGASSTSDAKTIALSIANSPLVKTAITGCDANWGRIVMAIGKTTLDVSRQHISVSIGGVVIAINGERAPNYNEDEVTNHMKGDHIVIHVDLGLGDSQFTAWGCNLTNQYISINADYRS